MNDFRSVLSSALRDEAEEISMSVDMNKGSAQLDARLDHEDRRRRRTRWLVVAAGAAAIAVGVLAWRGLSTTSTLPVVPGPTPSSSSSSPSPSSPGPSPTKGFASTAFGIPFVADLPRWTGSLDTPTWPTSQQAEWVTWNRCPDPATECIGLSFNRYSTVYDEKKAQYVKIGYASYLAYLEKLRKDGLIDITARQAITVGGRPATLLAITGRADLASGIGCHSDTTCDNFGDGLKGYYAVVNSAGLDPDGAVLVIWTRAGAVAAPEKAWVEDYRAMLAGLTFPGGPAPSAS
ncbi:MAG: hypothetical protein U0R68_08395 [Candidatus Nanopelagicales bacterium]